MSFAVDQFMQVRCKFQLTSETESPESIHRNNERIRLCTSVDLDERATLIVMICSNDSGNNHIVAYYIERRLQFTSIASADSSLLNNKLDADQTSPNKSQSADSSMMTSNQSPSTSQHQQQNTSPNTRNVSGFTRTRQPRLIVKQIYYHSYNEDIVALYLSESGNKLTLINASSTIYVIPIKNILLNLHAKQLRSSQGKSMYFYDASILNCCSLDNPVAIACWESLEVEGKSTIIVANEQGELSFISLEEKREINRTQINERIKYMRIIKDRFSYSLLITCDNFKQFRFALELLSNKQQQQQDSSPDSISSKHNLYSDEYTYIEKDIMPSWDRKPIPVKLHNHSGLVSSGSAAAAAIHRVLAPSKSRLGSQQSGLFSRERSLPLIFNHSASIVGVVDILGGSNSSVASPEPRLLRFFSSKQFYYRPQKPILVCRLTSLEANEMITHIVLTDRFLAIATDRDRCLINSRNCCNLKTKISQTANLIHTIEFDPLVKEVKLGNEEKILLLLKSPISNDQDNIIDSFLLVTDRSIYSIEARQSCRDMFTNLIDTHLGIKPPKAKRPSLSTIVTTTNISESLVASELNPNEYTLINNHSDHTARRKNSSSIISNFLCNKDEVYEKIIYDSKAFSMLFKLELNSLYEAYGDKLLLRGEFELANRFFQMAKFDYTKTLGKYIRLGAYKEAKLQRNNSDDSVKVDKSCEPKFLEFITSPEVTKALVRDISFTSEYLGYQQSLIKYRRYSVAALYQLDSFRRLVSSQRTADNYDHQENLLLLFTREQKHSIENIFIEFLNACLDESTEDSLRLWSNYINFYLNYVGTVEELEGDILRLLDSGLSDCRMAITLYKTIGKDETVERQVQRQATKEQILSKDKETFMKSIQSDTSVVGTPLECMKKLYNLSEIFSNEFLMRLLEKTLSLVPQSTDLATVSYTV